MILETLPKVHTDLDVLFYFLGQRVNIKAEKDELFAETACRFMTKMGFPNFYNLKFFYNSQELRPESGKTLSDYRIHNQSRIDVIDV